MQKALVLLFLACLVCVGVSGVEYCGSLPSCGIDQCCTGGFYHRYCRRFAERGEPCERPNSAGSYKTACPCQEGLTCSVIARCQ
ncbi:hypothetical protein JTE90_020850 [Oedothorax gibbosus]|uniref:Uncharacterized protein n=1 Tax=Oedothorax gibbosus TaxID=931172 RepID=A0AAV6UQ08_9ARAC|nr:hypothetical protein JTE90_020850 [Oedothorax gibbosus]